MTPGTQSGMVQAPPSHPAPVMDDNILGIHSLDSQVRLSTINQQRSTDCNVALLTAGRDRPYALGMAFALAETGVSFDFIGSNDMDSPELHHRPQVRFLNLRGDQSVDAGLLRKISRVLVYYVRLLGYAATARPKVFHILWNNKLELLDRTLVMLYYKFLRKKIAFTAHNVNIGRRDGTDSWLNHWTLKFQYRLCDHIFVHTARMKEDLVSEFGVGAGRVDVIPFGINRTVPDTALTAREARRRLGLAPDDKVILFFGNIAPYKGLEYLLAAFDHLHKKDLDLQPSEYRLVIAGRPKGSEAYWSGLLDKINRSAARGKMILKIEYVPDAETEVYFKAADLLTLPYTHIFQSGVLSLGYGFGLPVAAADVGSLKENIIEGRTGFVFPAKDSAALAKTIETYFSSDLFKNLENRRREIREYANERYSWAKVAAITTRTYSMLLEN